MISVERIMEFLPHRYPMLLVDRILELDPMKKCIGLKNVTINEAFFDGHYPGMPIMPGVLIIESMAQTGACMVISDEANKGYIPIIGSIDDVRFRKLVVPGDQLVTHTELLKYRRPIGRIKAHATVGDTVVAEMELTFKLMRTDE